MGLHGDGGFSSWTVPRRALTREGVPSARLQLWGVGLTCVGSAEASNDAGYGRQNCVKSRPPHGAARSFSSSGLTTKLCWLPAAQRSELCRGFGGFHRRLHVNREGFPYVGGTVAGDEGDALPE